jgi:hypothetical protein
MIMIPGVALPEIQKNKTHKMSIAKPNVVNIQKYKQFKSIDSHVLRDTKKRRRRKIHPNTKGLL